MTSAKNDATQTPQPREMTQDEAREEFVSYARQMVDYWLGTPPSTIPTTDLAGSVRWRVEGAVFSVLNALDGTTYLPPFEVVPVVGDDAIAFAQEQGENWFPRVDIGGELHEHFFRRPAADAPVASDAHEPALPATTSELRRQAFLLRGALERLEAGVGRDDRALLTEWAQNIADTAAGLARAVADEVAASEAPDA
jgi:hypothetical protein